jgi:adenosylcobinamide kinase/adenosylcobinamide-phosphate guanylyltransferase
VSKITFILGGARSGKSTYALSLAKKYRKVAFVATCQPLDKEMQERIRLHKKVRLGHWKTFEEPKDIEVLSGKIGNEFDCIIIDCLTLLVSNLILDGYKERGILKKIDAMLVNFRKKKAKVIIISNEVGLGLVPANKLGRAFRDAAGKVNQIIAKEADEVFFVVSGIPCKIKRRKGKEA